MSVLEVVDLSVRFSQRRQLFRLGRERMTTAVDRVSFTVDDGESIGIVGESGCGKSTLIQALLGLEKADYVSLKWAGRDLTGYAGGRWAELRRYAQIIFQDPVASLNPRMTVFQILSEPIRVLFPGLNGKQRRQRVVSVLRDVELGESYRDRYPHELSGGQCQRVSIARALVVEPAVLICDESFSALDLSVQAEIVALLQSIKDKAQVSLIFVSHDVEILPRLVDRVLVMLHGRIVEIIPSSKMLAGHCHPHTKALVSAVPGMDRRRQELEAWIAGTVNVSGAEDRMIGCRYSARCPFAGGICLTHEPVLSGHASGALVACHFPLQDSCATEEPGDAERDRYCEGNV